MAAAAWILSGCGAGSPAEPAASHAAPAATAPTIPQADTRIIRYEVKDGVFTVTRATTPYDAHPASRAAFLHWLKLGFEHGFAGKAPLMVEWVESPAGRASSAGYDLGLEEGGKHAARADRSFSGELQPGLR